MKAQTQKLSNCYGEALLPLPTGGEQEHKEKLEVTATVEVDGLAVYVSLDCCDNCNQGSVVWIENRNGIPHVIVWADNGSEDPTHTISLAGAMRPIND